MTEHPLEADSTSAQFRQAAGLPPLTQDDIDAQEAAQAEHDAQVAADAEAPEVVEELVEEEAPEPVEPTPDVEPEPPHDPPADSDLSDEALAADEGSAPEPDEE